MKNEFSLLIAGILLIACGSDDEAMVDTDMDNAPDLEVLTEALEVKGLSYGPESRQFLDLYKPASDCATPIYFDAHPNGGNTELPSTLIESLNGLGIAIIAWESLTSVNTPDEVDTGWADAELMFQWVIDNAQTYNLDTTNMLIGGSSRGSILSWRYGHRANPGIKGLYMYNALPTGAWEAPEWWIPTEDVQANSPPVSFVYRREPGCSTDPIDPDIHDPNFGFAIVEAYEDLNIRDRTSLVHSIGETDNTDRYQFLEDFAISVLDLCDQ